MERIVLVGAEEVARASNIMSSAADDIMRAATILSNEITRLIPLLTRFCEVLERKDG